MSDFRTFTDALKGATAHMDALKGATAHMDALKGATAHMDAAKAAMGHAERLKMVEAAMPHMNLLKQVEEYTKTSDKIRALAAASMPRADIARHLGVRYQHVRNVLVRDEEKAREAEADQKAEAEGASSPAPPGGLLRGRLGADGRVVVPAAVREKLGLEEGTELVFTIEGDEVRLASMATHLKRLQEKVRSLLPNEAGLVDELIADRKREAGAE